MASVRGVHATDGDVDIVGDAARALIADDDHAARAALTPIAGQTIVTHPVVAASQRPGRYPVGAGVQTRSPSRSVITAVYRRDRFTCVYCARRTVVLPVLGLVSELLPTEVSLASQLEVRRRSPLLLGPLHDARTRGGGLDRRRLAGGAEPGHRLRALSGPEGQPQRCRPGLAGSRTTASWDGLTALLPELWQRAGRPARMAAWVAEYQRRPQS